MRAIGTGVTGEDQLREFGESHVPHFVGVFPSDRVPPQRSELEAMVLNVDPAGTVGTHWCGLFRDGERTVLWDSFGRPVAELFPHIDAEGCERDVEQPVEEAWCGAGCLAWLQVAAALGLDAARQI